MLLYLYNHSQQLEGRADGTSISTRNPIQEKGNYYKRGWQETERGGLKPLSHKRHRKKLLGPCRGPALFDKPSSSLLDYEKHHVNCCPCTKAKLLDPFSTNLLYRVHWSKIPYILGLGCKTWSHKYTQYITMESFIYDQVTICIVISLYI